MTKKIRSRIILILLFTLGLAITGWFLHQPWGPAAIKKADVQIGARDLTRLFCSNESVSDQQYLYKTLSVRGVIKNIRKNNPHDYTVWLAGNSGLSSSVSCRMDSNWYNRDRPLRTGDSVVIRGTCAGRFMDVILLRCILERQVL